MRVVIAEDEVLLREGISRILTDEGHEIVATAGDADDLLGKARAHQPDLVLTDIRMPPDFADDGLRAAKRIRQELPGTAVVVLSQYVDATGAMDLLADGAAGIGYLLKRRILNLEDSPAATPHAASSRRGWPARAGSSRPASRPDP